MPTIEERIRELEEELRKTKYNKATEHHILKLKARIASLKRELERRKSAKGGGYGFAVKKSGNATVALVGYPSVGKSTILNGITNAESEVGEYAFTTLNIIPGVMEYEGAKIQVLDMPGIIEGASRGRGRGREILSVVRGADLIVLVVDVFSPNPSSLIRELHEMGIRLNESPPQVVVRKRASGGLDVGSTVPLTRMTLETAKDILREFGYINAEVIIREDITPERFIDHLRGNCVYIPAIIALNKIDLLPQEQVSEIMKGLRGWKVVPVSAAKGEGLERLKEAIFRELDLIRIYLKPQGGEADMEEPLVIKRGSTVEMVCRAIHRDFVERFRFARVWGRSARFPGQRVGLEHVVEDGDVITIILRR